jgi:hypothetical protein
MGTVEGRQRQHSWIGLAVTSVELKTTGFAGTNVLRKVI